MGGSVWVQNKIELFEGELVVFKRANSPNFYMRVYVKKEGKHYQKSCKTKNEYNAIEFAKAEYKSLQQKVAKDEKVFTITISGTKIYAEQEHQRERRGMIKNDWVKKKQQYLANTFTGFFGAETKVNEISDKDMQLFIDYRIKSTKRKQTIKQEIGIIKHFIILALSNKVLSIAFQNSPSSKSKNGIEQKEMIPLR